MPAIIPNFGAAAYGAVRANRDARSDQMQEEGFETDQAIRRARLNNETAEAPIRRQALQLGVDEQQRQAIRRPKVEADEDYLRSMNIDTAALGLKERQELAAQASDARQKEDRLKIGLGQFHQSGDPQAIADAIADITPPRPDGSRPRATRGDDGNITLYPSDPSGQPIVLKTTKINGVDRSPDEQLAMYAYKLANPVEHLKQRYATDLGVEKESAKQDEITQRAITREQIRAEGRAAEAEGRARTAQGRAIDRGVRLGKTFVDSSLKTVSIPGHFTATYSSDDDAKLLPQMYARMGEIVRKDDEEPEKAAQSAITEVRTEFLTQKKAALDAAEKLRKAGVNPKDKDSMAKAKAAGNPDVDAFLAALGKATKRFGPDVGNYLLEQVPAKK